MTPIRMLSVVAGLAAMVAPAVALDTLDTVRFAAGASSATLHGDLVRGDTHYYAFDAAAGQAADIRVTSLETNASLVMYGPGSTVSRSGAEIDIDGTAMAGGDPASGLDPGSFRHWAGRLPASGTYYIMVGGDRGNASYDLTIAIK